MRDAEQPDFKKNLIPAGATDGSVNWVRGENLPVMGRLMQIHRKQGMASNYDCCVCNCPYNYTPSLNYMNPINLYLWVTSMGSFAFEAGYEDCNSFKYWYDYTTSASWSSGNPSIASMQGAGLVKGVSGGTASISASYSGYTYTFNGSHCIQSSPVPGGSSGPGNVVTVSVSCSPAHLALGSTAPLATKTGNCNTTATPSGGSFSWSVNKSTVTLNPSGGGASYTAASASSASGDTVITVQYTAGGQNASAQSAGITVHNPTSLNVDSDTTNPTGKSCNVPCLANPGNGTCNASTSNCGYSSYLRQRQYSVIDQFQNKFQDVGLSSVNLTESIPYTTTCPNLTFTSGSWTASPFSDSYYLCSTCCLPQGPGCSAQTNAQQTIYANSVQVRTESIAWTCTSVTVSP